MSVNCYCHPKSFECETMYDGPPRYPVPSCIGTVMFDSGMICLYAADDCRHNPMITWYNESYGFPIPSDHGLVVSDDRY